MPASGLPLRVRWQLDDLVFNGPPDQAGREWVIDTETGWSASPPVRTDQAQPRTGAHGGWPPRTYRDPRTIRLDGWIYSPTWEARRDAEHHLAALCAEPGREYPLRCTEETGELLAHVTQDDTTLVTVRPGGRWLDFSLQLVAADPRKYSASEHAAETGLPGDSTTGLDFGTDPSGLDFTSADAGLDFGPQLVTGRATAANTGTADTAPTLTLTGPLTPPVTITRPDNGARITYRDPLDADDRLVIDTRIRTAYLGTASRRHRVTVTDWDALALPPASVVDFVLGHAGDPNPAARLVVTWRSAWW
ncbi:MAG: hypothetical protein GEV28_27815 [Actinophytocola sp.]|uniref:phage tail domain-containing protein n=1 Tax=Actinophytocola sp. TaxID=1872138 RepID=UPI001320D7DF|nr:phage tail domain-containing protein [Actinophytocola sp.]MPZ83993.1 hypothetical protein [Actinophytocola sp.]